ncbi:MAG: hypothetical protein V2J08_03810 [Desulfotignum sp.]|jgi:hypothetical protein|nr:hypothetical protein [Desulfotignum sp.]
MTESQHNRLFKKGIWIKEQKGTLTMGSLENGDHTVMKVPEDLCARIYEVENEMIDALYGDKRQVFDPDAVDMEKLLARIEKKYAKSRLRISFSADPGYVFTSDYDAIYTLLEKLVESSLKTDVSGNRPDPLIYINASILDNHLCIIYRDSEMISDPSTVKAVIDRVKTRLGGEIDYKSTPGQKAYYDIMIPGNEE